LIIKTHYKGDDFLILKKIAASLLAISLLFAACGCAEQGELPGESVADTSLIQSVETSEVNTETSDVTTQGTTEAITSVSTSYNDDHPVSYNDWDNIDRNTKQLYISCVSQYDIDMLAEFDNLELLSVRFGDEISEGDFVPPPENVDISIIKNMTDLKSLHISSVNIIGDLTWIKYFDKLIELEISGDNNNYGYLDMATISNLKNLENLGFNNLVIDNFSEIQNLQSLQSLAFFLVENEDLSIISSLINIKTIKIWNGYTANDYSFISELNNIESLCVSNISDDIDYSFLSHLGKLTDITIINSDITNCNFINYLNNPENITRLDLQNNEISLLSGIEKLSKLKYLYIDNNEISDLSPLLPLDELAVITLSDNPVSDLSFLNDMQNVDKYGNGLMIQADNIDMTEYEIWDYVNNSEFIRFGN
jgi:hypothetical protein